MRTFAIVIALLTMLGTASAISVSMSNDIGNILTDITGNNDATISVSMIATERGISSNMDGYGDVTIGQSASGGGQAVQFESETIGGSMSSEIGATDGGVFGKMDYEGEEALSYADVDTLARNPGLSVAVAGRTASGAVFRINGGTIDATKVYHINPSANTIISIPNADWATRYVYQGNYQSISHNTLRDAVQQSSNFINSASGYPLMDGISEVGSLSWGTYDGKNCVMFVNAGSGTKGKANVWYDTNSRHVLDFDIYLNEYYAAEYIIPNQYALDNMKSDGLHEMMHAAGLKDWTAEVYPGIQRSQTNMGTARWGTSVDRSVLWNNYHL